MFNKPGMMPPPMPPHIHPMLFSTHDNTGRLYSGNKPIAYLTDLLLLHNLVVRWLMGNSELFGIYGYTPLSEDGKIDIKYIKYLDILSNEILVGNNIQRLNFKGNLVKVLQLEDGSVTVYIDEDVLKNIKSLHLSLDCLNSYSLAICPLTYELLYDGYEPGLIIKEIVFNNTLDVINFLTSDGILFNNNNSTYFVITLLDSKDNVVFTVLSAKITGNNPNVIMGDNRYCTLLIKDFHLESSKYIGNISLKIQLSRYFQKSCKFKILVTHHNGLTLSNAITWSSLSLFYCIGTTPDLTNTDVVAKIYINDENNTPICKTIQGITYVTDGYILLSLSNIKNINADAIAAGAKVKVESNIFDELYVFSLNDLSYDTTNSLDIRAIAKWQHIFKIKAGYIYPKLNIFVKITVINGYGLTTKLWDNIQIKYRKNNVYIDAYIDTFTNINETTNLILAFDGNYILSLLTSYIGNISYQFNTYNLFLLNLYLQVIPNVGLVWPDYFGIKNLTYNTRYFKRIFYGDDTNIRKVYGGTFIFGNLTLLQFKSDEFNVRISIDDGNIWYDLKHLKDGLDIKGIYCLALPYEDGLAVRFALPLDQCFNHNDIICFELSMKSTSTILLTYIKLRNEDNTLEF